MVGGKGVVVEDDTRSFVDSGQFAPVDVQRFAASAHRDVVNKAIDPLFVALAGPAAVCELGNGAKFSQQSDLQVQRLMRIGLAS